MNNKEFIIIIAKEPRKAPSIFSGEELDSIVNPIHTAVTNIEEFNKQKGAVKILLSPMCFLLLRQ
jgi:hypothetical protein